MNTQGETENSTLCENDISSKFDQTVWKNNQQNPADSLIVSKIPQKTYKFQWIIRQFSKLQKNKALYSTNIHASTTFCYQLKLVKYQHGFRLFSVNKVQSIIRSVASTQKSFAFGITCARNAEQDESNEDEFPLNLEYQISATDSKGKELMKWSVCFFDDSESESYKIGEYINNSLEILPDDLLILNCNLNIISMPISKEIPFASKPSLECSNLEKLSTDLRALYQNSLDTDVTLVVGTDIIRAHKLMLTARSNVFQKIFQHDMKETEHGSVTITDVTFSALQRLVEFLYSGVFADGDNKDMDLQELYDLYYAADKYEVLDLREMVGNTMLGKIQVDNASEILIWADRHNDTDLKSRVMNFIRLNFEDVSNTDIWESCALHQPRLAAEVVNFCAKKQKKH